MIGLLLDYVVDASSCFG